MTAHVAVAASAPEMPAIWLRMVLLGCSLATPQETPGRLTPAKLVFHHVCPHGRTELGATCFGCVHHSERPMVQRPIVEADADALEEKGGWATVYPPAVARGR